ncbi:hypothetical protein CLHOM_24890 [Clostridium homopropionicum DSM 5847]|uniref:DUF1836 domain-containing protein n=1 Tax=Clostridium homopropionicum DSM 5847 TaxID=1121318 RepID=A0A0L6Z8H7_9CLOT|nr:DUF1836 domain-containing protein [Clostridium homopropionicum]KOA19108.1 hypothetical protein CLHOM_24890 [Clostridium homopropionicum DSM 5847]SFG83858.1 protein of unknown function [Clostridium homopropionicum]
MKNSKFILDELNKIANEISKNSLVPYEDLPQYDLFLSQVIDYLNDRFQEEQYTNNIVQNYIKNEVISKPEDGKKRGYTKLHLVQLVLLSYMRPILTTEEIKKVFALAFNSINDRTDDIISFEKAYKIFDQIQKESLNNFLNIDTINEEKFEKFIEESELKGDDKGRILVFLVVMSLIAQASAIKKLAKKIIDEYGDDK